LASRPEPVVVIGLGRFGSALALELAARGTEVLAMDSDPGIVQRHAHLLGQVVVADSTDVDALREVGVADFTRAVVGIGTAQEASILTTALLAELEVDHIWAKALNQQHANILRRVGAHHVVLPEQDSGQRVAHLVSGEALDYIGVDVDWALVRTRPPHDLVGVPLGETRLRAKRGVTVVSVKHEGSTSFTHADAATRLAYGDEVLVAGRVRDVERFLETV
jgi:trk system potassium uptake protein TrkA